MVTKCMLTGNAIRVHTYMENHQREGEKAGRHLASGEKKEKQKFSHCKDLLKTAKSGGEYKTVFLV